MKSKIIFFTLLVLFLLSLGVSQILKVKEISNQVVIIPITGSIVTESFDSFLQESSTTSATIISYLEKADKNPSIKAIILEINSPGGTVIASKEIADKVKEIKKPTVAWIREVGASGAYWIASSADEIVADPLSITGSIGVIGSYLEFSELFEKYGITYEQLTTGKYKDVGSPYRNLTTEERALLQQKLNLIHNFFVKEVQINRNLTPAQAEQVSTGIFYLGQEAKQLNLVDELGGKKEVLSLVKKLTGLKEINLVQYKTKKGFLDLLNKLSITSSFYIGKGIGSELVKEENFEIKAA